MNVGPITNIMAISKQFLEEKIITTKSGKERAKITEDVTTFESHWKETKN